MSDSDENYHGRDLLDRIAALEAENATLRAVLCEFATQPWRALTGDAVRIAARAALAASPAAEEPQPST